MLHLLVDREQLALKAHRVFVEHRVLAVIRVTKETREIQVTMV